MPAPTELAAAEPQLTILAPRAAVAWSAIAPTAALAASRALFALAGRSRLRPLDQHFGLTERAVLVFGDQLEADAAASLVHLEDLDVEDVATRDHVLDVGDAARPHVRDVEEAVGALLQLDERAEVGRLHDLPGVLVADLGLLRQGLDGRDGGLGLRAVRGVDEDRPVLLDVDLDVVVGLEPADGLAALADDESDLLGVDLDGRDPRGMLGELGAGLRDRLGHLVEDEVARPFSLFESASHDLLRDAGDLDVHLERRDAGP